MNFCRNCKKGDCYPLWWWNFDNDCRVLCCSNAEKMRGYLKIQEEVLTLELATMGRDNYCVRCEESIGGENAPGFLFKENCYCNDCFKELDWNIMHGEYEECKPNNRIFLKICDRRGSDTVEIRNRFNSMVSKNLNVVRLLEGMFDNLNLQ